MPTTQETLVGLSARIWGWMSAQDATQLATVLHEDAVFVHMGATLPRAEELEVVASGRIHYRDVDVSDVSVRVWGEAALVLTTLRLGAVVEGDLHVNPFVVSEVYVRAGEGWLLGSMSFTRLLTP